MDSPETVVLRSSGLLAEISTLGAELRRLATPRGDELLSDGDPAFWTGRAPILFPIVGALRDNAYRLDGVRHAMAKHGFARRSTFAVVEAEPDTALLRLSASPKTRVAYPFDFQLDIRFSLSEAVLTVEATVSNLGQAPMPASFGFHPALRWPLPFGRPRAEHRIVFEQDEPAPIRRIDAQGLLTPEPRPTPVRGCTLDLRDDLFTDDALIFDRLASRSASYGAESGPRIEVAFDGLTLLGVWTKPGAAFICIEPWAGLADPEGFDGDFRDKPGMMEVAPGSSRRFQMTLALTRDGEA